MANTYRYFMSANGYGGFTSYYDKIGEEVGRLYVIKGGPGCGKSGFMKRIGKRCTDSGVDVEYIHCAGDPDSVDGLIIPELDCAFADGTRPHVLEPELAGCTGAYIDLAGFCRMSELSEFSRELAGIENERKRCIRRGNALLASAGKAMDGVCSRLHTVEAVAGTEKRAAGIAGRELKKRKSRGRIKVRFITAFTYKGMVTMSCTVEKQCGRLYLIDDNYGLGEYMLRVLSEKAAENGYDAVLCPSPLEPEKPEALIIPGILAAFVCGDSAECFQDPYRHIRLDASVNREILAGERKWIRGAVKLRDAALEQAKSYLQDAKLLHDKIEEIYNPFVDFEGVYRLADKYAGDILNADTV